MSTQVTRLKSGPLAAANDTIELNSTQSEIERARFEHDAKMFALQVEFSTKRDKLREEYHTRLAEITAAT
jgi:hypothetical protein